MRYRSFVNNMFISLNLFDTYCVCNIEFRLYIFEWLHIVNSVFVHRSWIVESRFVCSINVCSNLRDIRVLNFFIFEFFFHTLFFRNNSKINRAFRLRLMVSCIFILFCWLVYAVVINNVFAREDMAYDHRVIEQLLCK